MLTDEFYRRDLEMAPEEQDDIMLCMEAQSLGERIFRRDSVFEKTRRGRYWFQFLALAPIFTVPKWTAKHGYNLNHNSEFYLKHRVEEFYSNRL